MTALVSRFALLGRSTPRSSYEALHEASLLFKPRQRSRRARKTALWAAGDKILQPPARFAS